jgi:molybdopterin molybdotransferase
VSAVATAPLTRRPDGKVHVARAVCSWDPGARCFTVHSAGAQGSHQLRAMAAANALAVLPDGGGVAVGEPVEVILLDR